MPTPSPAPPPKATPLPKPASRQWFRRRLLDWYRRNGRDLPWRRTSDPYHILVSEVMLQQTQVDRVLPKYHEWLEKYPSLEALADAPDEPTSPRRGGRSATTSARGACSRSRASRSRATAARCRRDEATLLSFKGIGAYTAGAVMSFAFGQRAAILDTNVARVLFRVFVGRGDPKAHAMKRTSGRCRARCCRMRHVFDFNQALMDFGATLCTARKPKCPVCPMQASCAAYPFNPRHGR